MDLRPRAICSCLLRQFAISKICTINTDLVCLTRKSLLENFKRFRFWSKGLLVLPESGVNFELLRPKTFGLKWMLFSVILTASNRLNSKGHQRPLMAESGR